MKLILDEQKQVKIGSQGVVAVKGSLGRVGNRVLFG